MSNTTNYVYRATGGKINLDVMDGKKPAADNAAAVLGQYAAQGTKSDENAIYDASRRLERTAAVMAFVAGDYNVHKDAQKYDSLELGKTSSGTDFYSKIGYGCQAKNALITHVESLNFTIEDPATKGKVVLSGITPTESELASLHKDGHFIRNGRIYSLSSASKTKFDTFYTRYSTEKRNRDSVLNARTSKEKQEALGILHNAARTYVKNHAGYEEFFNIKNKKVGQSTEVFFQEELEKAVEKTSTELNELYTKKLSAVSGGGSFSTADQDRMKELESLKDDLDEMSKMGGGAAGKSSAAMYGRRIVTHAMMGSDMATGLEAYYRLGKVTEMAVQVVERKALQMNAAVTGNTIADKIADNLISSSNDTMKNVGLHHKKRKEKAAERLEEYQERRRAYKGGRKKEYKANQKERRKEQAILRRQAKVTKETNTLEALKNKIAKGGRLTKTEAAMFRKLNSRQACKKKMDLFKGRVRDTKFYKGMGATGSWIQRVNNRVKEVSSSVMGKLTAPFRAVSNAIQKIIDGIKKKVLTIIIIPIGMLMILFIGVAGITTLLTAFTYFISETVESADATDLLDKNTNYMQLIVNQCASTIAQEFTTIACHDARTHYMVGDGNDENGDERVENEVYDWYKAINDGIIGDITASEDGETCLSINENLVPVISVMRYRFMDDIDFLNWRTAKGYVYYMYIRTHGIAGYRLQHEDDHQDIYEVPFVASSHVSAANGNYTINRPEETCDNVYVHGYKKTDSAALNALKVKTLNLLNNTIRYMMPGLGVTLGGTSNGLWSEEDDRYNPADYGLPGGKPNGYPHDSKGYCEGAQAVNSTKLTELRKNEESYIENYCPGYEHSHTGSCYSYQSGNKILTCSLEVHSHSAQCWICMGYEHTHVPVNCDCCDEFGNYTQEEHTHGDGKCDYSTCTVAIHDHTADCEYNSAEKCSHADGGTHPGCARGFYCTECGFQGANSLSCPKHGSSGYQITNCTHNHTAECCSVEIHTHGDECCSKELHEHEQIPCVNCYDRESKKLTEKEHTHTAWKSAQEPGCYVTLWVCPGHCGGHETPVVDVVQDMEYETIVDKDVFKVKRALTNADFLVDSAMVSKFNTLEGWRKYWDAKITDWFAPFSTVPLVYLENFFNTAVYDFAEMFDIVHTVLSSWISGEDTKAALMEEAEQWADKPDMQDFEGWHIEDDSGKVVLDAGKIDELRSFYGSRENHYKEAVENWKDFDVYFPASSNPVLSDEKIEEYMEDICRVHELSEERQAVVREALKSVGHYYYELTPQAHENGLTKEAGRSDSSGFVSGILSRALGRSFDLTDGQYADRANKSTVSRYPGDILANKNGGTAKNKSSYDGHVLIYIGRMSFFPGSPEYVIDCSEATGGSALVKTGGFGMNLNDFEYCYSPY